jgi:GNAT superfamily N-acetyltransferase
MHIGLASPEHHESLVDLLCEMHAYYNPGASEPRDVVRSYLVEVLLGADSPLRLVVASQLGEVAGFAAIALTYSLVDHMPEKRRHCWLKELYVRAPERGRGVGRALMSWVARYSVDHGCSRIDWPVKEANTKGRAFYESLGARQVQDRLSYRLSEPYLGKLASGASASTATTG